MTLTSQVSNLWSTVTVWKTWIWAHLSYLGVAVLALSTIAPALAQDEFDRIAHLGWPSGYRQSQRNVGQVVDEAAQTKDSAAPAVAGEATSTVSEAPNGKLNFSFAGQINRAVMHAHDDQTQKYFNVDNDHSSTRAAVLGVLITQTDITLGSTIEVGLNSDSSSTVNQAPDAPDVPLGVTLRKAEIFAVSDHFGTFWIGHGSMASDGTAEVDLSGTRAATSNIRAFSGGISFADSGTNNIEGNPKVRSVFSNLDGGRNDRLRYSSPALRGFVFSASWSAGVPWDAAIGFNRERSGNKFAAAVGYSDRSRGSATINDQITASASYLHESGWAAALSVGSRSLKSEGRANSNYYYGKLGYRRDMFRLGLTKMSIDFGENNDLQRNGDRAKLYGAQIVQNVENSPIELDLYLSYRNYGLDRPGANFDDINLVLAGARVRF